MPDVLWHLGFRNWRIEKLNLGYRRFGSEDGYGIDTFGNGGILQ